MTIRSVLAESILGGILATAIGLACAEDGVATGGAVPGGARATLVSATVEARVDALLRRMTVQEKIGQLVQYSAGSATGPAGSAVSYDALVAQGAVGAMLNVTGATQTNHFQRIAVEKSRLGIPLLFGLDVIHGARTIFPVPLALAASFDPALVEGVARTSAIEARRDGIQWTFAPMVDVARDARWGRIVESAGEDPYLGAVLARSWVRGYQQDDLARPDSIAACVKHFAAYGAAVAGREYSAVDMSDPTLRQVYLPPYNAAIAAGAATVMSAFNTVNGVPASANRYLTTHILRDEWGFDGFVVSDWDAIGELVSHAIAPDRATVARKALVAGVDMDMEGGLYAATLADQVRAGAIDPAFIDAAARRVLRVKFALGLFERPYAPEASPYEPTPGGRAQARAVARETIVLLKNDAVGAAPLLPLAGSVRTLALVGPLADAAKDMLGSWRALGDPRDTVTLRQALHERYGARLHYAKGCATEPAAGDAAAIAAAVNLARGADVVVLALGEDADQTGEAASRTRLELPGRQQDLLAAVAATGKPIVLVLFTGRPSVIAWAAAHIPAIVAAWYPGIEAGHAVADILFGDADPSAKLPASFPRAVGQEPLYYAQLPTGRPAAGDLARPPANAVEKYTSRYIDERNDALYPFGWGLGYTHFAYSAPTPSRATLALAEIEAAGPAPLTIGVDVRNTGQRAATEVVQLYLRNTAASLSQPVRELKGFARVTLAPGESRHVEFPLGFEALSFYDADSRRVVEPTTYEVFVGGSSLADAQARFEVR